MRTGKSALAIGALLIAAAIAAVLLLVQTRPSRIDGGAPAPTTARPGIAANERGEKPPVPQLDPLAAEGEDDTPPSDAALVDYLREKFGGKLHSKYQQIKAIEKLVQLLMKLYPEDWRDRVYDFLREAFPDLADELFAKYQKLTEYNDWLRDNRRELMKLPARERREALWDLRHKYFGEEAEAIWEVAGRNEVILERLEEIAAASDSTIDQKLDSYVDSVKDAYGDKADDLIQRRQTGLMNHFLAVESVQDDLHKLPPEERRQKLRRLRREMGLDDEALERWDELDRQRDREWETGQRYVEERERIAQQYEGTERERRITELQNRLFGPEADIIREEEEAGFRRFERRRRYGRE